MPLLVTSDEVYIRTLSGFFMTYYANNQTTKLWGIEHDGFWEKEAVELCQDWMKDGGTFLDIGANVGYYCLAIAYANPNVKVYAFEPIPSNFHLLEKNIQINKLQGRLSCHNLGVGEEEGKMSFRSCGQLSHVLIGSEEPSEKNIQVPITSLDKFCDHYNVSNIRMIKCDVEGFELFVLKGADKLLREHKPVLLLEIEERWTRRYQYRPEDIFQFMNEQGYQGQLLTELFPKSNEEYLTSMFLFTPR